MDEPRWLLGFRQKGWRFEYTPGTLFVGATHPNGGKQSVCEVVVLPSSGLDGDEIGRAIAAMLNGKGTETATAEDTAGEEAS